MFIIIFTFTCRGDYSWYRHQGARTTLISPKSASRSTVDKVVPLLYNKVDILYLVSDFKGIQKLLPLYQIIAL